MVVLQLGPFPPPHGGVQTNLVAIRDHLRRHGVSAPVINLTRHRRNDADDVYYPRSAVEVVRLLARIPADVVHIHLGGQLTPRLLGLCFLCTCLPGRRVVLTFHSGGYPSWARDDVSPWSLRGVVFRRLDAIVAVNEEIAALFRRFGVPASKVHVICPYAPVTVDAPGALPSDVARFRATHAPLLTTVGLLEPEYDLALQIATLPQVRRRHPDAGLVIIGSGSLEGQLRELIARSPVGSHVLLYGDMPHDETLRVIAASDLFLRTTLYDGDSVSVREALQFGVPVIASDNGMRPAGVHLVPKSDGSALEDTIDAVLRRPRPLEPVASSPAAPLDDMLALYSRVVRRPIASPSRARTSVGA